MKNKLIKLISLVALTLPMLFAISINVYSMEQPHPMDGHPASIADGTDYLSALSGLPAQLILSKLSDDLNSVKSLSATSKCFRDLTKELREAYMFFVPNPHGNDYKKALIEYKRLCDIREKPGCAYFQERKFRILNDFIFDKLVEELNKSEEEMDIENKFKIPLSLGIKLYNIIHSKRETTFFILAALCDCLDIVRLFLASGVKVDQANNEGATALMAAVFKGHVPVVRLLLRNGADLTSRLDSTIPEFGGCTALEIAERKGCHEIAEMIRAEEARRAERKRAAAYDDINPRPLKR